MKSKLILILTSTLVIGCAVSPTLTPNRGIAQLSTASELAKSEKEFQDLWSSPAPAAEFLKQVERMASLYFRAQKFLLDFDAELNGDLNALNRSESYRKLQVMRGLQEAQVEKVSFLYGRLIDMEQSGEPVSVKKANLVLSSFGRYMLLNRNKLNRLAMQNVVDDLRAVRAEHKQKAAELDSIEFKSPEEITDFLNAKEGDVARREALTRAAKNEAVIIDPEFDQAFVDSEKAEAKAARDPQSEINYYPSTGRSGNLMGTELPMGTFAITFDDGPHKDWTPRILQTLQETGFKTTFFWLAKNLANHRMDSVVQAAKQAGHILGNHSYTHADLSKPEEVLARLTPPTSLEHEIFDSTAVDTEIYGAKPSYFRCPYGSCIFQRTAKVREMIASQRMLHITWTIDSLDWQDKDPASVYDRVLKQVTRNGRGIILFHDIHPQSYAASTMLMKNYFAQHKDEVSLRTISQIVRELNSLPVAATPTTQARPLVRPQTQPQPQAQPPASTPSILNWLPWVRPE
jgi:peptidoglycan/xylan/chitin deacetylase (PgdA/CDA1 family)